MRTFKDVPVTKLDVFLKIDELMPPEPADVRPPEKPRQGSAWRNSASDLGKLDVGAYLSHYGIGYTVKAKGDQTIYVLDQCLFDPNHRRPDAAFIAYPPGMSVPGYDCKHDSCQGRTWKDARSAISGADSIAQFCEGYDPEWRPPKKKTRPAAEKTSTRDDDGPAVYKLECQPIIAEVLSKAVPPPEAVDPEEMFFEPTARSSRFVPIRAAEYIARLLTPLCYTSQNYWRYADGVWQRFDQDSLRQILTVALKDKASNSTIEGTLKNVLPSLIARREDQWPQHETLINVQNGMVDLETFELIPHSAKYGSRVQLPVSFNPDASWPLWDKALSQIFELDRDPTGFQEKYDLLQEYAGYCLQSSCRFQKALLLVGSGGNGKGVLIDVLSELVGKENVSSMSMHALGERFGVGHLQNKMVNFASETDDRSPVATETLKKVIVGDMVTAEPKYGPAYEFRPQAKFIFSLNKPPVVSDRSYGFYRRWLVLNFDRRFEGSERDKTLAKRIVKTELDGVFQWALIGLSRLLANDDFSAGQAITAAKRDLFSKINPTQRFAEECLENWRDIQR